MKMVKQPCFHIKDVVHHQIYSQAFLHGWPSGVRYIVLQGCNVESNKNGLIQCDPSMCQNTQTHLEFQACVKEFIDKVLKMNFHEKGTWSVMLRVCEVQDFYQEFGSEILRPEIDMAHYLKQRWTGDQFPFF